jgi:hypothetical protein
VNRKSIVGLGLTVSLLAGCGLFFPATPKPTETYTVAIAGVITSQPSLSATTYTVAGRAGDVQIKDFVAGAVPAVGDVLIAGPDQPTWGYTARAAGADCWVVTGDARVDNGWIEIHVPSSNQRAGVAIFIRIPKAATFDSPTDGIGHLLGNSLCVNSRGEVVAAH